MRLQELYDFAGKKAEREFSVSETVFLLQVNKSIFFSWGVSKMINVNNKSLILNVSGHHHKGWVVITLGWEDLYKVFIVSTSGKLKNEYEGIFFDSLVEIIDNRIEKIPDYKF